jgi:acyl CoA:acetate/3-ketoacid CoA transferase alpha subunit
MEGAMNKIVASPEQAVADIPDGATVAIAGFGVAHRFATSLICALRDQRTKELTLVCNSLGDAGATRGQILAENNQVKKLIAAFSVRPGTPTASEEQIAAGAMEVELVPRGSWSNAAARAAPGYRRSTRRPASTRTSRRAARSEPSTASPTSSSTRYEWTTPC